MITPIQQTIIERLSMLCTVSPDIRMGQMLANLGFLSEDFANQSLWDIDDEQFLKVIEIHLAQMSKRQGTISEHSTQPDEEAISQAPANAGNS